MSQAGRLAVIERHTPAGAGASELTFDQMMHRAKVLANSGLVPKAFVGKPEAIVLVGTYGAELGMSLVTSLQFIDAIEGRPSVNAQGRLFLIRRAGHDAEFVHEECDDTKAVIRGRRRGSSTWQTVTWTAEEAEKAHLLDEWVERWCKTESGKSYLEKLTLKRQGDKYVPAAFGMTELPAWAAKEIAAGRVKRKENWWSYRADQLVARAASRLCRRVFSDVMMGLGVEPLTAEEQGYHTASDLDETAAGVIEDQDDDVVDGELVDQGEDNVMGQATTAPPGPVPDLTGRVHPLEQDPEKWAAFTRWLEAGEPLDESGAPAIPPAATIEPERGPDNGRSDRGDVTAPVSSGPVPGEWRARAVELGKSDALLLKKAREYAAARGVEGVDLPRTLDQVTDPAVIAALSEWMG